MSRSPFFDLKSAPDEGRSPIPFTTLASLLACLLLCSLALGGCVKERQDLAYYHPHKNFSRWAADLEHCEDNVSALKKSDRMQEETYALGVENCMKAKGYVYGFRPFPPPQSAENSYSGSGGSYLLLDSTFHSGKLAKSRAKYLESTGIWGVVVMPWNAGDAGVWQQVLIGTFDSVGEARTERSKLVRSHGLNDLIIVRR